MTSTAQLALTLPLPTARGRNDFCVTSSNAAVVKTLDTPRTWPQGKMVLTGPFGSGKSHLAQIWANDFAAKILPGASLAQLDLATLVLGNPPCLVVDDAEVVAGDIEAEQTLFHLHNMVLEAGGYLLITGTNAPNRWAIGLPDLASRLQASATAQLPTPDDHLLAAVLVKLFADRQITVAPNLIPFLVNRMERSLQGAHAVVDLLDRDALARGKAITRARAAGILGEDETS
jgi:chromosomal replication initiation ATPase DnaA